MQFLFLNWSIGSGEKYENMKCLQKDNIKKQSKNFT